MTNQDVLDEPSNYILSKVLVAIFMAFCSFLEAISLPSKKLSKV